MRERGPYEYDKFVLNILQLYNAINLAEIHEMTENTKDMSSLIDLSNSIDSLYEKLIGNKNEIGLTENVFTKFYKYKGDL
jgi:energy-converting hydrogenase A subunit M